VNDSDRGVFIGVDPLPFSRGQVTKSKSPLCNLQARWMITAQVYRMPGAISANLRAMNGPWSEMPGRPVNKFAVDKSNRYNR
jgi:hypothetical protein